MTSRAWPILSQTPGRLALYGLLLLPVGFLGLACGVGLLVLIGALSYLIPSLLAESRRLQSPDEEAHRGVPRSYGAGAFAVALMAALAVGVLVAIVVPGPLLRSMSLPSGLDLSVGFVVCVLVGSLAGTVLVPLVFAPLAAAAGVEGMMGPVMESFADVSKVGVGRVAARGAQAGASVTAMVIGFAYVGEHVDMGVMLLLPFALSAWLMWVLAAATALFVEAEADAPSQPEARTSPTRGLGALALGVVPALLVVFGGLLAASLTPTALSSAGSAPPWGRGVPPAEVRFGHELRIPSTSIQVRAVPEGVEISTADGGGAGLVRSRWADREGLTVVVVPEAEPGLYRVYLTDLMDWQMTRIDRQGVRLDDGLGARTSERLGTVGRVCLGIAAVCLFALIWLVASRFGEAQTLSAVQLETLGEVVPGARLQALSGRLQLSEDGAVLRSMRKGRLRVRGDAWVDALSGAIRLRLPVGMLRVMGDPGPTGFDGAPVTLLSRFETVRLADFRSGPSPWPKDARLVFGSIDDAGRALVQAAARSAAWIALPLVVACLVAASALLYSMLA